MNRIFSSIAMAFCSIIGVLILLNVCMQCNLIVRKSRRGEKRWNHSETRNGSKT